jgi:hypothetical protein
VDQRGTPVVSDSVRAELRTPRSAAIAGIAFALLLTSALVLFRLAGPLSAVGDISWLSDPSRLRSVRTALNLVPFAGIAFLWFIGVIRTRLGDREDKLFATVFLGSGLLFVAMLFIGASLIGGVLLLEAEGRPLSPDAITLVEAVASTVFGTFGTRMSAVFILSATTAGLRTRAIPRWLALLGYVAALTLLLTPPISSWSQVVFPLWVLLVSGVFLVTSTED